MTDGIVVVGAGIVGASIAYHLASRGVRVTLVEQDAPGAGATGRAFGWINPGADGPPAAAVLRALAVTEYRRLERELGVPLVNWSGALTYGADAGGAEPIARVAWLDREQVGRLEPNLVDPPERARYAQDEGALEPEAVARLLVERACAHRAAYLGETRVHALCRDGARVTGVQVDGGVLYADTVVLAAGVRTAALAASAGVVLPVDTSPAIRIRVAAPPGRLRTIVSNRDFEAREAADGSLVLAEDYLDDDGPDGSEAIAGRALDAVRRTLRGAEGATLGEVAVGRRPMPADAAPVIGTCADAPGLYVAVMHSGVTLAAAVGRLVADALRLGGTPRALAPCSPDRFAGARRSR
jgi:glycine/D-amino acid oxidase-like deaminating enzyme